MNLLIILGLVAIINTLLIALYMGVRIAYLLAKDVKFYLKRN